MAEKRLGWPADRDGVPLQPAAEPAPGHRQQPGERVERDEGRHSEAGQRLPGAAGHQDQAGEGDRRVQEAAGWRGVTVRRREFMPEILR